jgi:hypothetical protein
MVKIGRTMNIAMTPQRWAKAGAIYPQPHTEDRDTPHKAKQRMCMDRLRAERRGKDTSCFPKRERALNGCGFQPGKIQ